MGRPVRGDGAVVQPASVLVTSAWHASHARDRFAERRAGATSGPAPQPDLDDPEIVALLDEKIGTRRSRRRIRGR